MVIRVSNLNFEYDGKRVLHDVSFEIKKGDIVALVGPNGAGKSTLMRSIAGLDTPVSGMIAVKDVDVLEDQRKAHEHMGYLSDFFGLFEELTVEQHLYYMAGCHDLSKDKQPARVAAVIDITGLQNYKDAKAGSLSRGYRQRLGVAMSILHEPQVLLLDEPASGMDPEARIKLSELLLKLRDMGMTLVVSSHILAELEDYCTSMLVIREGRIIEHVYMDQNAKKETASLQVEIKFSGDEAKLKSILQKNKKVQSFVIDGETCLCDVEGEAQDLPALLSAVAKKDIAVFSFAPIKKSLQSHYMKFAEMADHEIAARGKDV